MFSRVARADPDATSRRGIDGLKRRGERFDGRDELGVGERLSRTPDRDRIRIALEAEVEVVDRPQDLLR